MRFGAPPTCRKQNEGAGGAVGGCQLVKVNYVKCEDFSFYGSEGGGVGTVGVLGINLGEGGRGFGNAYHAHLTVSKLRR